LRCPFSGFEIFPGRAIPHHHYSKEQTIDPEAFLKSWGRFNAATLKAFYLWHSTSVFSTVQIDKNKRAHIKNGDINGRQHRDT
jgi:hypothetical protein